MLHLRPILFVVGAVCGVVLAKVTASATSDESFGITKTKADDGLKTINDHDRAHDRGSGVGGGILDAVGSGAACLCVLLNNKYKCCTLSSSKK